MRKAVENVEIRSMGAAPNREVSNPHERPRPKHEEAPLILADDENGRRKNPVQNAPHPHTSTDQAADEPQTSTVTDGEDG